MEAPIPLVTPHTLDTWAAWARRAFAEHVTPDEAGASALAHGARLAEVLAATAKRLRMEEKARLPACGRPHRSAADPESA